MEITAPFPPLGPSGGSLPEKLTVEKASWSDWNSGSSFLGPGWGSVQLPCPLEGGRAGDALGPRAGARGRGSSSELRPWGPWESPSGNRTSPLPPWDNADVCWPFQNFMVPCFAFVTSSLIWWMFRGGGCCSVAKLYLTLCNPWTAHVRLLCPSPSPGVCSNSCPLSWGCYPAISSSVAPLLLLPSIFPSISVFSSVLVLSYQVASIGVSASASVLPVTIQGWSPFGLTGLISLQPKGLFKSLLQHHNLKASVLSLLYGPALTSIHDYWKNHSFGWMDLCQQGDVSALFWWCFVVGI